MNPHSELALAHLCAIEPEYFDAANWLYLDANPDLIAVVALWYSTHPSCRHPNDVRSIGLATTDKGLFQLIDETQFDVVRFRQLLSHASKSFSINGGCLNNAGAHRQISTRSRLVRMGAQ